MDNHHSPCQTNIMFNRQAALDAISTDDSNIWVLQSNGQKDMQFFGPPIIDGNNVSMRTTFWFEYPHSGWTCNTFGFYAPHWPQFVSKFGWKILDPHGNEWTP